MWWRKSLAICGACPKQLIITILNYTIMSEDDIQNDDPLSVNSEVEMTGLLGESLKRNSAQIRQERAAFIFEDLEQEFDRAVVDMDRDIKRKISEQNRQFDFSPGTTISLTLKDDFDPRTIMEEDDERSLEIRNLKIKRNMRARRYNTLFGDKYQMLEVE